MTPPYSGCWRRIARAGAVTIAGGAGGLVGSARAQSSSYSSLRVYAIFASFLNPAQPITIGQMEIFTNVGVREMHNASVRDPEGA